MTNGPQVEKSQPQSAPILDFEHFVRSVSADLLGYFTRRIHPPDEAGDCLGDVLLTLWRRIDDLPPQQEEPRAWAFGIANKVLSNHIRSSTRRIALTERLRQELRSRPGPPIDRFVSEGLIEMLKKLQLRDRELILLVAWEGFTVAEAASIIRIRPDAARARYSRLRAKLRRALNLSTRST